MTAPGGDNRGGPRAPDGVQRPASLPFARGPNRSDMSELPGTPGTPLPPSPTEPNVRYGQAGRLRRILQGVPIERAAGPRGLEEGTAAPDEPVTSGIAAGPGPGPDSLIQNPRAVDEQLTAQQMRYAYPLLMRLATLPNATSQTKILAQRIRANLPVSPEQMPALEPDRGAE